MAAGDCPPSSPLLFGATPQVEVLCDSTGQTFYRVQLIKTGVPVGAYTDYTLGWQPYAPVGVVGNCKNTFDFEQNVFCDGGNGDQPFISRALFDEDGNLDPDGTGTFMVDGITPYVVIGPVKNCDGSADFEIEFLCDDVGSFIRHYVRHSTGIVTKIDTMLDGTTIYVPTGTVKACDSKSPQTVVLCDEYLSPASVLVTHEFLRHFCRDCVTGTVLDTELDGLTAYTVQGTVKNCTSSSTIEVACKCDDTDGDGIANLRYKQVVSISPNGTVTVLATYDSTLTSPYTPIEPIDCTAPGDDLVHVRPRYVVKQGVGTWVLLTDSTLPTLSVTFTVVKVGSALNPPTITDSVGTHPLYANQSVTFSVIHARDVAGLASPLSLTTRAGDIVAVFWEEEIV